MSRRHRSVLAILACASILLIAAVPSAGAATRSAVPRAHASVVGGGRADPAQWPFAVAIFRKGRMHCSGSVIAPTKVLTAGHCVAGFNVANLQVIISRPTLRDTAVGQVIGVTSGKVHPDFEQTGLHDVAVLTLAQPTSVRPVALRDTTAERRPGRRRRPAPGRRVRCDQSLRYPSVGISEDDHRAGAH